MKEKTTSLKKMVFSTTILQLILDKIQSTDPLCKSCKSAIYECLLQENFYWMRHSKIYKLFKIINLKLYFKKLWIEVMDTHAWTSENNHYISPQINAQTKVLHFFLYPNKIKHLHLDYHFTIFTWNNVYLYISTNMYK